MEPHIQINDKIFDLVVVQRGGITAVYKSGDEVLRIGDREKIAKDLALHKKMEALGFPVATLIGEGESAGLSYFIEASLGDRHLGNRFAEDVRETGTIGDATFQSLLGIVDRFGRAQLKSIVPAKDFEEFSRGIHLDILCQELPHYSEAIGSRFRQCIDRFAPFPFVITHGDFNPNNLYPEGVIDFEDSFYGPFGFDLVTALVHISYFPDSPEYEYVARYRFTPAQSREYLESIDSIATDAHLPRLSEVKEDFEFCRASWSLVQMHQWPRLQQFRYELFIQKFLGKV